MITGRSYLERGNPVVVTQWGPGQGDPTITAHIFTGQPPKQCGPRNVRIRRADGTHTIRPFRGLRRPPGGAP